MNRGLYSWTRGRWVSALAVAVIGVFAAIASPAVATEKYQSKSDAAAAGNPAAFAPSVKQQAKFEYKGGEVASADAAEQGLACNEVAGKPTRCYDSVEEADAAMGVTAHQHAVGAARRPDRVRARASAHCDAGGPLRTYKLYQQTTDGGRGWYLGLYSRQSWFDMSGGYNNDTSSYGMNAHSGHLSDYSGGGGYWYPGNTSVCGYSDYMEAGSGWDNRVGSRYRN